MSKEQGVLATARPSARVLLVLFGGGAGLDSLAFLGAGSFLHWTRLYF